MLIAQISDSHIAVPIENEDDDRIENLRLCVTYLNDLDAIPSLVVHSGDISHNGRLEEYEAALAVLQQLNAALFVMAGNRDNREVLRDVFANQLPDNCHPEFIQYMTELDGNCLLMLDTVSGETNKGQLCDERLSHFAGMLDQADGKPVTIFMHHPTFEITASRYPFQFEDGADAFAAVVGGHPNVSSVRCGHTHRQATGDVAGIAALTIPSIAEDLRLGDAVGLEVIAPVLQLA